MATIRINRFKMDNDSCFSTVKVETETRTWEAFGVEKPWRDNKRMVSCIPSGSYLLEPFKSSRFGEVWCFVSDGKAFVKDYKVVRTSKEAVKTATTGPLRFACLIHAGNKGKDVQGCLAIGSSFVETKPGSEDYIGSSRKALYELRKLLGNEETHKAIVTWCDG